MNKTKFTHTTYRQWESGKYELGPIPKSPEKQIELLEHAVYEMFEWLMDELDYDNPGSIADRLSDQVNKIAYRAYEKGCALEN
jgi:hypothetical protein